VDADLCRESAPSSISMAGAPQLLLVRDLLHRYRSRFLQSRIVPALRGYAVHENPSLSQLESRHRVPSSSARACTRHEDRSQDRSRNCRGCPRRPRLSSRPERFLLPLPVTPSRNPQQTQPGPNQRCLPFLRHQMDHEPRLVRIAVPVGKGQHGDARTVVPRGSVLPASRAGHRRVGFSARALIG